MATPDLYPIPFVNLVDRLDRELAAGGAVYGLAKRSWWRPNPKADLGFDHFGHRLGNPAGPASGPHTQLAQNLVMSWLGGARFMELKTVQVLDELEIPRPCIFVPHIGYNVEWSQELRVPQSAEEYVKGWWLLHMLCSEHGPGLWPEMDAVFDMSLGYDLAGIKTPKVEAFIHAMQDASSIIDKLRDELPPRLAHWGEVPCPTRICDSVTLSTFHGCPADEIEAIATHTMRAHNLHTVVKLNPTLLGYESVCNIVNTTLGYDQVKLSPEPFEADLQWPQLMEMIPRLQNAADEIKVGFGLKLSNTLVMQSDEPPFGDGEMYLSGAPLHVLAVTLAGKIRTATRPDLPLTFSAGVDADNFGTLVGAGIGPVTSCSDLLKAKGYARLAKYLTKLEKAMIKAGAADLDAYKRSVGGGEDAVATAAETLVALGNSVSGDPRYTKASNEKGPKRVDSHLELLDCLTCDICIPVCPNGANFAVDVPKGEHNPGKAVWSADGVTMEEGQPLIVAKRHQIGNLADACNLCGQCDPWCPENGGPYLVKPNVFLDPAAYSDHPERDGFHMTDNGKTLLWRRSGQTFTYAQTGEGRARFETPEGGALTLENDAPVDSEGEGEVDLRVAVTMRLFLEAFAEGRATTYLMPIR